jgi:twitching motility protein PilT
MCGAGTKIIADSVRGKSCAIRAFGEYPSGSEFDPRGKTHQLPGIMQTGQQAGMLTFTQSFQQRVAAGLL